MKRKRMTKLTDVTLDEVSLVDRPANQHARIVFTKRQESDMKNPLVELAKRFGLAPEDAVPTKLDTMLSALRASITTVLKGAKERDEQDDLLRESMEQFVTTVLDTDDVLTPVAKADDTFPIVEDQDMTEEQKAELQKAASVAAELQKKLDAEQATSALLEKRLAEVEKRDAERAVLAKAEALVATSGQATAVGVSLLKAIGDDAEALTALDGVFKALKAAQVEANLFKAVGRHVSNAVVGKVGDEDFEEKVNARALELQASDSKLTKAQAIRKAAHDVNRARA